MKIKRTLLIMFSRFIRGAGMGLGASGIVFTVWFFFLSASEFKYLWGGFAYAYIYDEWDDYQ